jgi:cysteine desulfurase / selenocysteine lyase
MKPMEHLLDTPAMATSSTNEGYDVEQVRAMFPILERRVQGKPLVYLDHAATSHKPHAVIQALVDVYSSGYSNIHRGAHTLAREATEAYERARTSVARFLHAPNPADVVFTSGATEGFNLLAHGWARRHLRPGDRVALTLLEHHANIVPWQEAARAMGAHIDWVGITADGQLDMDSASRAIGPRTRLVCTTHLSNVTGAWVDVQALAGMARGVGARLVVDGSQAAAHAPVHVHAIGCDAYVVTGHKLCGPSGSGAVWLHPNLSAEMEPFHTGGGMVGDVGQDGASWAQGTARFEAGTPGIANQIAFGTALDTLMGIGMERIAAHGAHLAATTQEALRGLPFLELQGDHQGKAGIFSFTGRNGGGAEDIGTLLDAQGIAVRAGRHCAHPLLAHWGLASTCRASLGLTTTTAEIDALVRGLEKAHALLG